MLLTAISVFTGIHANNEKVARLSSMVTDFIQNKNDEIKELADANCSRVIYLGSNGLTGLAQEASLKLLELTDGLVDTMHESSLGFRHGPKSALNSDTLVVLFMSGDSYTRKYDMDILNELLSDNQAKKILALAPSVDLDQSREEFFAINTTERLDDLELLFPYIVFAQIYGFHRSLRLGNRPDTPSSAGTVNRVVKGVNIHACTA
jgi:tagatose-6-phosphate ketose/aldose isomerase